MLDTARENNEWHVFVDTSVVDETCLAVSSMAQPPEEISMFRKLPLKLETCSYPPGMTR